MKKLPAVVVSLALMTGVLFAPPNGHIRLLWDYPVDADTTFNIHYSTDLAVPMTSWLVLTNVSTTNVDLDITPGKMFFYVTATNFWGESDPSNVAHTPGVYQSAVNTRIIKTP